MEEETKGQNIEIEVYLLQFIKQISVGKDWRHTNTTILPDGRVIIQLKLEKKHDYTN
jgi:hypothetical protein